MGQMSGDSSVAWGDSRYRLGATPSLQNLLGGLESWALTTEDLVPYKRGYAARPLGEGESRGGRLQESMLRQTLDLTRQFAPLFQDMQMEMMERDPLLKVSRDLSLKSLREQRRVFGQQSDIISEGLRGLEEGGLPADVRKQVLEESRAIGASRGLLESPSSALFETSQLVKQRENLRAIRLGQADAFLSGAQALAAPGLGTAAGGQFFGPMAPDMNTVIGAGLPGLLSAHAAHRGRKAEQQAMVGQGIGQLGGMALGSFFGPGGMMLGSQFGAAAGGSSAMGMSSMGMFGLGGMFM